MGGSGSHCEDDDVVLTEDQKMIRELSQNKAYYAAKEAIMIGKKGSHVHLEYVNRCEDAYRKKLLRSKI